MNNFPVHHTIDPLLKAIEAGDHSWIASQIREEIETGSEQFNDSAMDVDADMSGDADEQPAKRRRLDEDETGVPTVDMTYVPYDKMQQWKIALETLRALTVTSCELWNEAQRETSKIIIESGKEEGVTPAYPPVQVVDEIHKEPFSYYPDAVNSPMKELSATIDAIAGDVGVELD